MAAHEKLDEIKLRDELKALRSRIPDEPSLNPIVNVAFELSRGLEAGDISFDDLKGLSERLMDRAAVHRARMLRENIGLVSDSETIAEFKAHVADTAAAAGSLEAFEARWRRPRTGIVFTAHPTFGMSRALSKRVVEIATGDAGKGEPAIGLPHRPDEPLTLDYEHGYVQDTIHNVRMAYANLLNAFYDVAVQQFGPKAYKLRPRLATVASWVGYDLDGRTDISWDFTFKSRLEEKRSALAEVRDRFMALRDGLSEEGEVLRLTRQVASKLDLAIASVDEQIKALREGGPTGAGLAKAANVITRRDGYNLTSTESLRALLDQLIDAVPDAAHKQSFAVLAALIEATGLGMSHIHVRVNSVQIANAFRAFVHEPWTRDLTESQASARIVEMIRNVKPETVNFETLDLETATAIRQFALAAQFAKHVDSETPIRYLIAECESPSTILIAIFFAKLLGVDDICDISPLFETPAALETGARFVERLLAEEAFRDYAKGRKRIAIQTGYSDAGRFIGQIAAGLAHERLQHGIADVVAKAGLSDVETLIFSTHGESMGRGAHPGSLRRRLRYVLSSESRWRFFDKKLPVKHETSFQGGDGWLYFATPSIATRSLATIVRDGKDPGGGEDVFYEDQNFSRDFQLRLVAYQQDLFAHSGYRALLGAFGPNLLFKSGSRPVKRQGDHHSDRGDPARMRAIPNNAILQQFGYVANVVSGLGTAAGSERDRFVRLAKASPRLKHLVEMIARAKQLSSINALGANAIVFDPGFWTSRASWGKEAHLESAFRSLAESLLEDDRASAITGLAHHLRLDAIDLHSILSEIGLEGGKIPDNTRLEVDLLQAVRLALIMRIFILSAQLPKFATRNDVSHAQVFDSALALSIPEVVSVMRQMFPLGEGPLHSSAFEEKATFSPRGVEDYGRLHNEILKPMEEAYELVREIGTGISHHWNAFG